MEQILPAPVNGPVPPPHTDRVMRGISFGIGAFFLLTAMQAAAKTLSETHSIIEIAFYRNMLGLVPLVIYMRARGHRIFTRPKKPGFVFLRVLLGSTGVIITFAAVKYLPMADATVIFFTGILMTPAMAYFFLGEYIGPHRWAAIIVGLAGVALMLHPSGEGQLLGFILAFTAAFLQGATAVILRHLRSETSISVTFYFLLCGMVISGVFMPFVASIPDPSSWALFIFVGFAGALGQYLITRAYSSAPASVIAPFGYSGLIWASLFDIWLWGYVPGWSIYAGGLIIVLSNLYIGHRERLVACRGGML
ncbi:MAG: DMT family transporter [Alphaproteobacteria bacterium]